MPTSTAAVAGLYARIAHLEEIRLADHPMEREITLRTIRKTLVASINSPKRIADIGGGPGKVSFALVDEGYKVDLVDLSPDLLQLAQAEQDRRRGAGDTPLLESIQVGNAVDRAPLQESAYDAVLLLGPLYHLMDESERATAVRNAAALLKPVDGFIFVAFISIGAHLRDIAVRNPGKLLEFKSFYAKYVSVVPLAPSALPSCPLAASIISIRLNQRGTPIFPRTAQRRPLRKDRAGTRCHGAELPHATQGHPRLLLDPFPRHVGAGRAAFCGGHPRWRAGRYAGKVQ
jgi:SAM-dependent methyltransferase